MLLSSSVLFSWLHLFCCRLCVECFATRFNKSWRVHFGTDETPSRNKFCICRIWIRRNRKWSCPKGVSQWEAVQHSNLRIPFPSSLAFSSFHAQAQFRCFLWTASKNAKGTFGNWKSCCHCYGKRPVLADKDMVQPTAQKHAPKSASKQFSEIWCSNVLNSSMRVAGLSWPKSMELERISKEHVPHARPLEAQAVRSWHTVTFVSKACIRRVLLLHGVSCRDSLPHSAADLGRWTPPQHSLNFLQIHSQEFQFNYLLFFGIYPKWAVNSNKSF